MRKFLLLPLFFIAQWSFSQQASFVIEKKKTEIGEIGEVILSVIVENHSDQDITILKPAINHREKWRYYDTEMVCKDFPIWTSGGISKKEYSQEDLLVIPSKSKKEIKIDGSYNGGGLACNSKTFKVKLKYDVEKIFNEELTEDEKKVIEKLSRIKIESKKTKIVIKK